jgi:cytoskeleton protein RodZ
VTSPALPSTQGTTPSPPELLALASAITQARLGAGLGVAELAKRLNMGVEQLEALESGDLDRLPEPVFVIAQARRIAQNLGVTIDGEILALRQSGSLNSKSIELQNLKLKAEPAEPSDPEANQRARGPGIARLLASLALAGGVAAGSVALWQQWQAHVQQQAAQAAAIAREAAQVAQAKQAQAAALARSQAEATSLTLSSVKGTWLEVKTLQGKPLFRGDFTGRQGFPLKEGLRVLAGRPDLVLVQIGITAARPLGSVSKVEWQTFAATKAKPAAKNTLREPAKTLTTSPSKATVKASRPTVKAAKPEVPTATPLPDSSKPTQAVDIPKAPAP